MKEEIEAKMTSKKLLKKKRNNSPYMGSFAYKDKSWALETEQ